MRAWTAFTAGVKATSLEIALEDLSRTAVIDALSVAPIRRELPAAAGAGSVADAFFGHPSSRLAVVAAAMLSLAAIYAVAVTPVNLQVALDTGKGFPDGSLPRILAAVGSGVGSLVLIGGALWSAWVFLRRRRNGRRALSNIVIAAGVLIVAAGGTAAFTGTSGILELTNLIGVSVMFLGFLLV